jgi:hypothetical protein
VVLEKDGENQLDRSCEKSRSITKRQGEKNKLQTIKREGQWGRHILRRNCILKHVIGGKIEGRIEVTGGRGTRRKQILDELENKEGYWKLCRTRFARGNYGPVVRQATERMISRFPAVY